MERNWESRNELLPIKLILLIFEMLPSLILKIKSTTCKFSSLDTTSYSISVILYPNDPYKFFRSEIKLSILNWLKVWKYFSLSKISRISSFLKRLLPTKSTWSIDGFSIILIII